jgi:hypothetical protein
MKRQLYKISEICGKTKGGVHTRLSKMITKGQQSGLVLGDANIS